MYYGRILLIFVTQTLKFSEERVVSEGVWFALHDLHGKAFLILQVKPFIRCYCVVRVERYRPSAKDISKVVLYTLDMLNCVIVDLEICLNIQHPSILNLCNVLELEVLQPTAVRQYLNDIITVCSVEVAFLETVLDSQ